MTRIGSIMAAATLAACSPATETSDDPAALDSAPAAAASAPQDPAATAAAGVAPATRIFRDWMAVCDNANRCVALTGGGAAQPAWLRVEMDAGPEARPVVTIGAVDMRDGEPLSGARLSIDARVVATDAAAVPLLVQGRAAAVTAGGEEREVSLSGAAAALLWIDERQGRLDTPTALARKGARPAATVPAATARPRPVPVPVLDQSGAGERPLSASMEALAAVKECRVDVPDAAARTWRLGVREFLWEVPCYRGAYNFGSRLWIADAEGNGARAVGLPAATGEPTPFIVNGDFDPATAVLTSFDKGRGMGDCGTSRTWVWTGRGFVLTRETAMEECWGITSDAWPVTYEAHAQ